VDQEITGAGRWQGVHRAPAKIGSKPGCRGKGRSTAARWPEKGGALAGARLTRSACAACGIPLACATPS
jgi:hypothetical protein